MDIPSDVKSYWLDLAKGRDHAEKGDIDQAIYALTDAIRAADRDVRCPKAGANPPYHVYFEALYRRGLAYAKKKKTAAAISDLSDAIAEATKRPPAKLHDLFIDAYLQRGIIRVDAGDFALAIDDFTSVIGMDGRNFDAYYHRGLAYHETGADEKAAEDFHEAGAVDPHRFAVLQPYYLTPRHLIAHPTFPDMRLAKTLSH
jgi:tetratricopeptide (TPR) repeat protein